MKHPFLGRDMMIERFQREQLIDYIDSLGRRVRMSSHISLKKSELQSGPRAGWHNLWGYR